MAVTQRADRVRDGLPLKRFGLGQPLLSRQFPGEKLQAFGDLRVFRSGSRAADRYGSAEHLFGAGVATEGQQRAEAVQSVEQANALLPEVVLDQAESAPVQLLRGSEILFDVTHVIAQVN